MKHVDDDLVFLKFSTCFPNQRSLEALLSREFLKRSYCTKKRKMCSWCSDFCLQHCNGIRLLFGWSLPKPGTWSYYYWLRQQFLALVLPLCSSLREMRMCCLWEDRTNLTLKSSPWFTLFSYQTGFASKKPQNPSPHLPPLQTVPHLFNRLSKTLRWKHGSKEQTKLNSRLCLTRCLSSCFATLLPRMSSGTLQQHSIMLCASLKRFELFSLFHLHQASFFQHRWSINGYPEVSSVIQIFSGFCRFHHPHQFICSLQEFILSPLYSLLLPPPPFLWSCWHPDVLGMEYETTVIPFGYILLVTEVTCNVFLASLPTSQ